MSRMDGACRGCGGARVGRIQPSSLVRARERGIEGSECDVGGARVPERVVKASNASSDASTGVDATGIESTGVKKRQWFGRGQAQDEATD